MPGIPDHLLPADAQLHDLGARCGAQRVPGPSYRRLYQIARVLLEALEAYSDALDRCGATGENEPVDTQYPVQPVAERWRCIACGAEIPPSGIRADFAWRWNGTQWEHHCNHVHPQAGHFPAEPIGEVADHYIWEVDAGNVYWCIAADENDALALVIEAESLSNGYCPVAEHWSDDGWPEPERVDYERANKVTIYDERDDTKISTMVLFALDGTRRILGCSEW